MEEGALIVRAVALALIGALAFTTDLARADEGQGAAAAEALFRDGRALLKEGKLAEACDKFAESKRLDPAPGTMINLARCYEDVGRTASAWATYRELAVRATHLGQAARAEFGTTRAAQLEPQLATIVITVAAPARVPGLVVRYDGMTMGSAAWGTRVPVDPGRHRITANAPGSLPWTHDIDVATAASAAVEVPPLVPFEAPSEPAATRPNSLHVAGIAGVAVGVLGVSAGLITRGMAKMDRDASADLCVGGCSSEGSARASRADDLNVLSTVLLISGAALTVAGGTVSLLTPRANGVPPRTTALR